MRITPCEQIDSSHPHRYKVKEISKTKIVLNDLKWDDEKIVNIPFLTKALLFFGLISIDYKRLFDIEESLLAKSNLCKTKKKDALEQFSDIWKKDANYILNEFSCFNTFICEWNKKYTGTDYNWYMNPYVLIIK